eukprot:524221-Alexandrium_andersonii.AAC.1
MPGLEAWNLSHAATEVWRGFDLLATNLGHVCCCCGRSMDTPGATICDAGQAYEVLDPSLVLSALDMLLERAYAAGTCTVTVRKEPRCCGKVGGSIWPRNVETEVLTLAEIRAAAEACLRMRLFKCGT